MTQARIWGATVLAILLAGYGVADMPGEVEVGQRLAVVTAPGAPSPVARAARMLQDEIRARTGRSPSIRSSMPGGSVPAIVLGIDGAMPPGSPPPPEALRVPPHAEGYALWTDTETRRSATVCVAGRDPRGALFGAGRLLRALRMEEGRMSLPDGLGVASAPSSAVRGHELGYRNKSNTYDAWSLAQYEQYIRDLAVFGANTVQLVVQLDALAQEGPHMTEPVLDRTVKLARLVGDYGLAVWLWLPPSGKTVTAESAPEVIARCRDFFARCSPIDAVFVPGGDPGDTPPETLLPLLSDLAGALRASHPQAEVWLSNEDMSHEWNADLFATIDRDRPDWLTGVIFGTWVKMPLRDVRRRLPQRYPIVQYADITHCIECQYPVPHWDRALALTLGREPINPRPGAMAHIHRFTSPMTSGFVTYSDGVNDDVNKVVWSALGWDPEADVGEVLAEYGRYFVGEAHGESFARAIAALEANWRGPLAENAAVESTLAEWLRMAEAGGKALEGNWRFQMGLLRACYDAYIRSRLIHQTALEEEARSVLARTDERSVDQALDAAEAVLARADTEDPAPALRRRIEDCADRLFHGIGMQLAVERYGAANWERGAVLDALDMPLNDRPWLEARFEEVRAAPDEPARRALLDAVLGWDDPGPGGFYDDLGNAARQPHLVQPAPWEDDPGFVESPQDEFIEVKGREGWRKSWLDQAQTLYGHPLRMRYQGLDPARPYRLRVTYAGRFRPTLRLVAGDDIEIHGPLPQPDPVAPLEFAIPTEATRDGTLDLEWQLVSGRGCQVAEVWLLPVP